MVLMFYIRRKNNPWTNVIYVMDRKRERERNILQKGLGICHSPVLRIWKVPGSNSSWSLDEMGVCKCWTGMWSGTVEWTREWTMELMYRRKFHFRSCSSFFIHFTSVRPHIQSMSKLNVYLIFATNSDLYWPAFRCPSWSVSGVGE